MAKYWRNRVELTVVMGVFAWFLKLRVVGIATVLLFLNIIYGKCYVLNQERKRERKRFEDVSSYMEQMLASFYRTPKILSALEDTKRIFEGDRERTSRAERSAKSGRILKRRNDGESAEMYPAIEAAIYQIRTGTEGGEIYRKALGEIEKSYGCRRLYRIHDFMIRVEKNGGDCRESLELLTEDGRLWNHQIQEMLKEKQQVAVKATLCVGMAFLICALAVAMLPEDFGVTGQRISQVVTTLVVICNLFFWYLGMKLLCGDILHSEEQEVSGHTWRRYEDVMQNRPVRGKKLAWIWAVVLGIFGGIMAVKQDIFPAATLFFLAWLQVLWPDFRRKNEEKKIRREVEKAFPDWLLGVALCLQTDNVQVSLAKASKEAPKIMERELARLQKNLQEDPVSIEPYLKFFASLKIPEITSAMRMLYGMETSGAGDLQRQLQDLAKKDLSMQSRAEKMRTEDMISGVGFLSLFPMLTGVVKLLTDLMLVILYLVSTLRIEG